MSETVERTATRCPECGSAVNREACGECNATGQAFGLGVNDEGQEEEWSVECPFCKGGSNPVCECGWGSEGEERDYSFRLASDAAK